MTPPSSFSSLHETKYFVGVKAVHSPSHHLLHHRLHSTRKPAWLPRLELLGTLVLQSSHHCLELRGLSNSLACKSNQVLL